MRDISNISVSYTEFWYGASYSRANPNVNRDLIENHLGLEWNPDRPIQHFSYNTDNQNIFLSVNHQDVAIPIFEYCYFAHIKMVVRGTGHGNEAQPDFVKCEFYCPEAAGGGVTEFSPLYYFIALGSSYARVPVTAQDFVFSECEFYNSLDQEVNNEIMRISVVNNEENPNIIKDSYFHHAHESLVHVYSGHVIFKNCDFEHTSDACIKQRCDNNDLESTLEVHNCRFRYFGDHSVYMDALENDNFQLIMKNCIVTEANGIGFMNHGDEIFADRDGAITLRGNAIIENCTIYNNRQYGRREGMDVDRITGIYIANDPEEIDITIRNCIIFNNDIGVTYEAEPEEGNKFQFCCLNSNTFDVEEWDDWGAPGENNITANPNFVDDENEDIHLLYNSVCINAGNPLSSNDPDGSQNDLGAFGGSRAGDFKMVMLARYLDEWQDEEIEDYIFFDDMDDYCLIGPNEIELDIDDETVIERDTYRMTADLTVTLNDVLTIDAGTIVNMDEDVTLRIFKGTGIFNGDRVLPIQFKSITSEQRNWGQIHFDRACGVNSVNHCTIESAAIGIHISGVNNEDDIVNISNVRIKDCSSCGVKIYNSVVRFGSDAEENGDNVIKDCGLDGIYVSTVEPGDVELRNINITDCETGIYLFGADPEIEYCHIYWNREEGIKAQSGSLPDLSPGENQANTIEDNDNHEICLYAGSVPVIKQNNIIDLDEVNEPDELMIWISFDNLQVTAIDNYYGVPAVQVNDDWFSGENILWDPPSNVRWAGADDYEPNRRDIVLQFWKEGNIKGVAGICSEILEDNDSDEVEVLFAVHYLLPAYKRLGCSLNHLRETYLEAADVFEDIDNSWVLKRYAARCLVDRGLYAEAIEEFDKIHQRALIENNDLVALFAEIDALELRIAYGLEDDLGSCYEHLRGLHRSLEETELLYNDERTEIKVPVCTSFLAAYPNPFNSTTGITYNLTESGQVRLIIYDLHGHETAVLANGHQVAGVHSVTWSPNDLPSGIYLCRMETGRQVTTMKLAMVK